ncbi:MAG: hypothetical protein CR974_01245 [Gammaproteobacteria bacterium]|nr:MAG: hypothetical protein CR974_01245 [Gammaproteobacteria bacterium]
MKIVSYINLIIIGIALSACVSQRPARLPQHFSRPLAESFAYERAASIAQVVPMKMGRFILESARAQQATVIMTLRGVNIADRDRQAVISEVSAIGAGLCYDKKSALVIQQGVTYRLEVSNARKAHLLSADINSATCASRHFIVPMLPQQAPITQLPSE